MISGRGLRPGSAGRSRRPLVGEHPFEDGFLGVQTVFRFVPDDGGFAFDNVVGHFLAPVRGQAVQELDAGSGEAHEFAVHAEALEGFLALFLFSFWMMEERLFVKITILIEGWESLSITMKR